MLGIDLGSFTTLPASWGASDYSDTKQLAIQAYVEEEAPAGTTNECLSIV
ncbi:MAG: hypothetical protein MZV70_54315 [Desulfobacterales bacterium]|nr:hypothetical protein [Desulfobacterales bacterium]